jgi:single-stranded-DNA-specific exonuclease
MDALSTCSDLFDRWGGQRAACGFSVPTEKIPELSMRFAGSVAHAGFPDSVIEVDCYLRPETVTWQFARSIQQLGPFGAGFPRPVFGMKGLTLVETRAVGPDENHWKTRWRMPTGETISGFAFRDGQLSQEFCVGQRLDVLFGIKLQRKSDYDRLEFELVDVAPASQQLNVFAV